MQIVYTTDHTHLYDTQIAVKLFWFLNSVAMVILK